MSIDIFNGPVLVYVFDLNNIWIVMASSWNSIFSFLITKLNGIQKNKKDWNALCSQKPPQSSKGINMLKMLKTY